ncbi:hypothetical protein TSUD_317470 [Trifolium subterraneum]|uniref:Uncharacterized protein n=1 Tax=Trifolium subterraneum TaxID=3900 RepID=A0A2Z6N5F5_TRISU|nr:hypothetical protein TSUD_317470 [Trifolium subterraneum]
MGNKKPNWFSNVKKVLSPDSKENKNQSSAYYSYASKVFTRSKKSIEGFKGAGQVEIANGRASGETSSH